MTSLARTAPWLVLVPIVAVGANLYARHERHERAEQRRTERTEAYLASLDLAEIERRGCDFLSPRYDLGRLGIPVDEIDPKAVYDFERLAEVEAKLAGVDRPAALRGIFDRVTAGTTTNVEKHLALLKFMHRASYHTLLRPLYPGGLRVHDPLVVLELNEMHCTHAARLAVDLWEAAGYTARCINFGAKTSAEVYYDDAWHYFGADSVAGNGIALFKPDGSIPSWAELSRQPEWIDQLPYRYELKRSGGPRLAGTPARSRNCFYNTKGRSTLYYRKSRPARADDAFYGWFEFREKHEPDWVMYDEDGERYQPGAVAFERVTVERVPGADRATATVRWKPAGDRDGDLLGYRVYVGSRPRGWSYERFAGEPDAQRFWHDTGGWRPEMYDALYTLPPRDVDLIETSETEVRIPLDPGTALYVTVLPFDAYHEQVGKTMYLQSNELRLGPRGIGAAPSAADRP